jgi:nucleoside-diphosphate-sugar epimerase
MRVLVTGNLGYLGPAVVEELRAAGHEVRGLDSGWFVADQLEPNPDVPTLRKDLRDVDVDDLRGLEAIVHLANLSNDPIGHLDPALTYAINIDATVRLGRLAREAGVRRFLNSSSCSAYGSAAEEWVDEESTPRPVTPYAESKIRAERDLAALADDAFCVVSLRNSTAFGYTPNLRTDLVVNDLTAGALLLKRLHLNSDGSAWRPIVHARDIGRAFVAALEADAGAVNGEVINVGAERLNYRVLEIATAVTDQLPGAELTYASGAAPDRRSYRVRFDKIRKLLPTFTCHHDLESGIADLIANMRRVGLKDPRFGVRLARIEQLRQSGDLDEALRRADMDGSAASAEAVAPATAPR